MAHRVDMTRRAMSVLFAAALLLGLVVPACMSIVCGTSAMGSMSLSDCLDHRATHDALFSADFPAQGTASLLTLMLGTMAAVLLFAPQASVFRAPTPVAIGPPDPPDPRGERLRA